MSFINGLYRAALTAGVLAAGIASGAPSAQAQTAASSGRSFM